MTINLKQRKYDNSASRARSNPLLAALRVFAIFTISLLLFVFYYLTFIIAPVGQRKIRHVNGFAHIWGKSLAFVAGIKVTVKGKIPDEGSLIAPNHLGYADILAILSRVRTFFIGKSEVAEWPVIGTLFRHSQQLMVAREEPKELISTISAATERLKNGHSVCVFLEGTSSGGDTVLPFLPSLVQPALKAKAALIPVAVRWIPGDDTIVVSEDIAYWKDHSFGPHSWRFLGLRRKHVELIYGEPINTEGMNRKTLAVLAHREVLELYGKCHGKSSL